jgi:starch synthase
MRVVFATAELAPLVRVGGLAEAASGLVRSLRTTGIDVEVVLPDYFATTLRDEHTLDLDVPHWVGGALARTGELDGFGQITLVRVPGIEKSHPYVEPQSGMGWADNDARFFGFSAAVGALVLRNGADVVHINDWHTGAVLAFVPHSVKSVLSIHNLAYQGISDGSWVTRFGGYGEDRMRAYEWFGGVNPLAGALALADRIVAVSPNYASEILEPANSFGLADLLASRGDAVIGILNGIDTGEWSPVADHLLPATYDKPLAKAKAVCRSALLQEFGLDASGSGPVIGLVTRLVEQKGVDLMLDAVQYLASLDARLVVLGAGDPGLAFALHQRHGLTPSTVGFREGYDLGLAHRIFAGSDLYLMPSRFEPCGLAQMQAMAYGTIPVTTSVGGLLDTVIDADEDPENGNGFRSPHNSGAGLVDALHRATRAWSSTPRRRKIVTNGMRHDWSWTAPAAEYAELYAKLSGH